MANRDRRVVFGRINRRNPKQETFESRTFAADMVALADSRHTVFTQTSTGGRPGRRWIAGDMTPLPDGDFMTGVLGFSEQLQQMSFDDESFSWLKGAVDDADSASDQTLVPFAVDLREGQRWVAFATTARLQPTAFRNGFEKVLNTAVSELGLMPTEWEVDLVTSNTVIREWLQKHPQVYKLTRTLKFTNPGKNLDEDRRQMRALAANRKTEEFAAPARRNLDVNSDEFLDKLEGTEQGDLDVKMEARGANNVGKVKFNSRKAVDSVEVEDFGYDLARGVEVVLAALREYVALKGDAAPQ
ncbi:hypothetical protein RD149_10725 [Gordonia westfalica]|uniref:Recombination-associated protein RdgC n=1 Tax=Gordonia westfalica TaxID=158898 RepID=A0ABU2GS01_9ACTN|nr:hypothetical protein [Gordonia westfalica]MDS1114243.1 hypothetical protein [Gordonia westfalica]